MPKPPTDPPGSPESSKISPDKSLEKGRPTSPDSSAFQEYKESAPSAPQPGTPSEISPMDLASKAGISTTPTFQSLLAQAGNARDTLGEVEKNLKTPNLKFKKSQSDLLQSKLKNANDHLASANQKMGANVPPDTQISADANPVERFIGLVTDGQNKFYEAHDKLKQINTSGQVLQPADMLLIQIKLSQAQQELEYSSVLLSKVVDSLKQIINIQI